jgi:hypothetical protein
LSLPIRLSCASAFHHDTLSAATREALHVLYRVNLGGQRGAGQPESPLHLVDKVVQFVWKIVCIRSLLAAAVGPCRLMTCRAFGQHSVHMCSQGWRCQGLRIFYTIIRGLTYCSVS